MNSGEKIVAGCLSILAATWGVLGCGTDRRSAPAVAVSKTTQNLHVCVTDYFNLDLTQDQSPSSGWTIGVMDRPELGTGVTRADGCTDIRVPERSDVLVMATKQGWVPEALTVHVADVDPPRMKAQVFAGLSGLPPAWWFFTEAYTCSARDGGPVDAGDELVGIVTVLPVDRAKWPGSVELIHGMAPVLHTAAGERRDWLYVNESATTYCNVDLLQGRGCTRPLNQCSGVAVMPSIEPGLAILEIPPGWNCSVGSGESSWAWPVDGKPNEFRIEVKPRYVTATALLCEPAP